MSPHPVPMSVLVLVGTFVSAPLTRFDLLAIERPFDVIGDGFIGISFGGDDRFNFFRVQATHQTESHPGAD
jgi:hypothetical protein